MERASLAEFQPLPEGAGQYPLEYIENNSAIKLRENPQTIVIGVCNPSDVLLLESLKSFHSQEVRFLEIDRSELAGYLGERLSRVSPKAAVGPAEKLLLDKLANDAPVINLVNSILIEAIRQGASDVHIEGFAERVVVRYRLDGFLRPVRELDAPSFPAVSTRLKIMANLNIMERRRPQDGRLTVHLGGDMLDVRVSVVPIAGGESLVLRLFNRKKAPLTLQQLGLSEESLALLVRLARRPHGLVLVSGPTGSGKTTSLNAVLEHIKSDTQKIIAIEDPIEYLIEGVNQIQTNDRIGLSFDTILRRVLRQDPNIIMVGEIRDSPTAELAIRASLTGHLVLSTLHTRDSVSVITRLKNLQIEPYLIAAVLSGSVAQRLVRRVCPGCREEQEPTRAEAALLRRHGPAEGPVYRGRGCPACRQSGYRGRIGLFELFETTAEVEQMIVSGRREEDIRSFLLSEGMKPLLADGCSKVLQGLTTVSEVQRVLAG